MQVSAQVHTRVYIIYIFPVLVFIGIHCSLSVDLYLYVCIYIYTYTSSHCVWGHIYSFSLFVGPLDHNSTVTSNTVLWLAGGGAAAAATVGRRRRGAGGASITCFRRCFNHMKPSRHSCDRSFPLQQTLVCVGRVDMGAAGTLLARLRREC